MGVKILNGGNYIGGRPVIEYRMVINDVTIGLTKEDFQELTKELGVQLHQDYEDLIRVENRYKKQLEDMKSLREKLLRLLYGNDYNDGWLIRKDLGKMDEKILDELIEEHGRNLGME